MRRLGYKLSVSICALLLLAPFTVAADDPAAGVVNKLLILNSNLPAQFPEGGLIDSSATLKFLAGAEITFLSMRGTKIRLNGPYSGKLAANAPFVDPGSHRGMLVAISRLIAGGPQHIAMAATRGATGSADDPWALNVAVSGDHCVDAEKPTMLWRTGQKAATSVTIKRSRRAARAEAEWPAGKALLQWPTSLPLEDNAVYLVRVRPGLLASKFKIHVLPDDLPSDFHRVAWMSKQGCDRQARKLLASLR